MIFALGADLHIKRGYLARKRANRENRKNVFFFQMREESGKFVIDQGNSNGSKMSGNCHVI